MGCGKEIHPEEWQVRSDLFVEELIEASPDVIALQEAALELAGPSEGSGFRKFPRVQQFRAPKRCAVCCRWL